jgi:hypothetical protein
MDTVIQPTVSEVEGVTVRFPQALLVASREDAPQFQQRVMIQTLGSLYEQGKISSWLGAQVLGCNRWEFYTFDRPGAGWSTFVAARDV